ncbi:MAG: EutN/CcmL family microcompartment protein [Candidatus Sumerlaeota bacterium]|nr:EutN/CcmL family microcompartment protein [Candidatus Sumerlaeota bacterium]
MIFAKVIGKVISTDKHPAFETRKLLYVQPLGLDQTPRGLPTVAIDYVDAGEGDIVLMGAAPGLAQQVFGIPDSPMRELIMGVIDRTDLRDFEPFGVDVRPLVPEDDPPAPELPADKPARRGKRTAG